MKKICISLTAILSVLVLSGCGNSNLIDTSNTTSNTSNVVSNTPAEIPTTSNPLSNVAPVTPSKLNCSMDMSSSMSYGMTMTQDVEVVFSNNSIKTIDMKMNIGLPDTLKGSVDQMYNQLKTTYDSQYGSINGVRVSTTKLSDTKIVVSVGMDFANMSSTDKSAAGFGGVDGTYETIKADMVSEGYTCY